MKRKIRYDRIFVPIIILCLILFGITQCNSHDEKNKKKVTSTPTVSYFLKTAIKPVGQTLYIYGGGWNQSQTGAGKDAKTIGLSKRWKEFYQSQDENYDYEQYLYQIHDGLDCAGYVGWTIYNTLETKSSKNKGYVLKAENMAQTFADQGLGTYSQSLENIHPGDIVSMNNAHVYIVLGRCKDGSLLIIHSSPPGVKISGTYDKLGNKNSQAVRLAQKIMKKQYPDWYKKYPDCTVDASFTQDGNISLFHWNAKTLKNDVKKKSLHQILQFLFKK